MDSETSSNTSDETNNSIRELNTMSSKNKTDTPTLADKSPVKAETPQLSDHDIEEAIKMQTSTAIANSKANEALHSLRKAGMSYGQISLRQASEAKKQNLIELIDIDEHNISDPDFNFADMSSMGWLQTIKYVSAEPTNVPQEVTDARKSIKIENDISDEESDTNGKELTIPKRWWRLDENSETPTEDAVAPPEEAEDSESQTKKRKKKKPPITPEFVNTDFDDSTFVDKNPSAATKAFLHFYLTPDRRKAVIREMSSLHPNGALIFSDESDEKTKIKAIHEISTARKSQVENSSHPKDQEHMDGMLELLTDNPTSFLSVIKLVNRLLVLGVTNPNEICGKIMYDEIQNKPVILEGDLIKRDNYSVDSRLASMISSIDSRLTSPDCSGNDTSRAEQTYTPQAPVNRNFSFFPSAPMFSSTPTRVVRGRVEEAEKPPPDPPGKKSRMGKDARSVTLDSLDIQTPDQYLEIHRKASVFLKKVTNFPIQGREPISHWKQMIRNRAIHIPIPLDYHPRYLGSPLFLRESFRGEAFPGVFRPSSSQMNEAKATAAFQLEKGVLPNTLVELNKWVKTKFPPISVVFDPSKHCIELEGYEWPNFWEEIQELELSRCGAGSQSSLNSPHMPRDMITSDQFIKLHREFTQPLQPYIANPLLTTLGPSCSTRTKFFWWSIPMPKYDGDLVLKNVIFDHNAMSFIVGNATKVGRCAVCGGLLLLPDHITMLAYFRPSGITPELVTPGILEAWKAQTIAVCYVHALTDGVFIAGRALV